MRNVIVEGDVPPAQHVGHEGLDVTIGERRQGNVFKVVDEIDQSEGVERAGQIDRAADQPTDRIPSRCRIQSLGAKRVAVLTPVRAPVGIAPAQRKLEAADTNLFNLPQYVTD